MMMEYIKFMTSSEQKPSYKVKNYIYITLHFGQNVNCWLDWHSEFFHCGTKAGRVLLRLPGVHLVCHHDMFGCVLDYAPQRVLHLTLKVMLVLCCCLLALTGFAWCIGRVIAGKVFAAVAAAWKPKISTLVTSVYFLRPKRRKYLLDFNMLQKEMPGCAFPFTSVWCGGSIRARSRSQGARPRRIGACPRPGVLLQQQVKQLAGRRLCIVITRITGVVTLEKAINE